jgi:isocitrate/isopropylmalate dehydrogenase
MSLKIGILPGDDIGLEVVPECVKAMKAAAACERLDTSGGRCRSASTGTSSTATPFRR